MPYVGKAPVGGGFHKLDALTASSTATYALTLGSAAYYPETANQLLVSLNGVIQAPQDSFTISGSNLVFDSALTSSDSIDFVVALGDVLGVGSVTDGAITTAKIGNDAVTKAKIGTTELDLATIKDSTGTNTAMTIDSSGRVLMPAKSAFFVHRSGSAYTWGGGVAEFDTVVIDTDSGWDATNYRYVFPVSGLWWVNVLWHNTTNQQSSGYIRKNGSNYMFGYQSNSAAGYEGTLNIVALMEVNAGDNADFIGYSGSSAAIGTVGGAVASAFQGYLLG